MVVEALAIAFKDPTFGELRPTWRNSAELPDRGNTRCAGNWLARWERSGRLTGEQIRKSPVYGARQASVGIL